VQLGRTGGNPAHALVGFAVGQNLVAVTLELVDGAGPIAVARHAADRLASVHETRLAIDIAPNRFGEVLVTTELPGVDPVTLLHLDDDGVVEVGTAVKQGMVLVGRLVPTHTNELRDGSLRGAPGLSGTVSAVDWTEHEIAITIATERALAVGDTLRVGAEVGVVAEIIEMQGDLRWPGVSGTRVVEKLACAVEVGQARSIGPYSVITQQPLSGKQSFGGQRIGDAELAALRARGGFHIIHELLTVKSDDVTGRVKLYESIVRRAPRAVATIPALAETIGRLLRALALDADLEADAIALRFLDDAAIRQEMPGVVKEAETVDDGFRPIEHGIMCERIFGDVSDAKRRRTREGRIELPAPVLHPWLFAEAARELGVDAMVLQAILAGERTFTGDDPETWRDTGPHAVEAKLGPLASRFIYRTWPVLPPDLRPLVPLDDGRFATSDLNDLYCAVVDRSNRLARLLELAAPAVILRNEHALLQHAIDNLVENGVRGTITVIGDAKRPLQSLVDQLEEKFDTARTKRVDYSGCAVAVPRAELTDHVAVPRELALELWTPFVYGLLEHEGHVERIRQAKALVDARDPRAFEALARIVDGYPVILFPDTPASSPSPIATLQVVLWDEPAFGVPPHVFEQLGGKLVLHVPIDPAAIEEALNPAPAALARPPHGWLARAADGDLFEILVEAALREEIDPCVDEETRDLLGRPPV